ncbi:MAG: helix-turn-helix transcriptional regulator, partial [Brevundimonas sp.]
PMPPPGGFTSRRDRRMAKGFSEARREWSGSGADVSRSPGGGIAVTPNASLKGAAAQVEALFSGRAQPLARQCGDDWRMTSVRRDVAVCHSLSCGRFDCALRGTGDEEGRAMGVQVVFIQDGDLEVRQWGRSTPLTAGDIFVCCGWLPVSLHAPERLQALIFDLPAWWAIDRFLDRFAVTPDLRVSRRYFASGVIQSLAQAVFDEEGANETGVQGTEMLAGLLKTALGAHVDDRQPMPRVAGRMGRIMQFIVQNIDKPGLSARDAAVSLKCSPRTVYQTCADEGTTFNAVMMDLRLLSAQHRLLRSQDQVAQVAYAVGFASLSHFSRLFKARFGTPPTAYRRTGAGLH